MDLPQFATFHHAYRAVLGQVYRRPQFKPESRGNRSRECLNVAFTLTDPRQRTPYLVARRTNIVFNYAETLWYLSGRDDLAMIGHYAPRLRALSADGERLTGSAYGPRLFTPLGSAEVGQWDQVVELLRHDPDSKRAVMTVMRPGESAQFDNPDVACTLALQFLLRDGHLHMVATMRGNDAVIGLVCDVFAFTFIHEFTAVQLRAQLGSYTHQVSSMHINESDLARVDASLTEHEPLSAAGAFRGAAMPMDTSWRTIEDVARWEEDLRTDRRRFDPDQVATGSGTLSSAYWRQVVLLFEVYRQVVHQPGQPITSAVVAALTPAHRWLVAHRWPERFPSTVTAAPEQS
ncbi:thymidylate synthase [Actinoallomurus acanthiterrae]